MTLSIFVNPCQPVSRDFLMGVNGGPDNSYTSDRLETRRPDVIQLAPDA